MKESENRFAEGGAEDHFGDEGCDQDEGDDQAKERQDPEPDDRASELTKRQYAEEDASDDRSGEDQQQQEEETGPGHRPQPRPGSGWACN